MPAPDGFGATMDEYADWLVGEVADSVGGFDPIDWQWHRVARIWQTPGEGEEFMATVMDIAPEDQGPTYVAMGVPEDDALAMVGQRERDHEGLHPEAVPVGGRHPDGLGSRLG